jgi:hypothetical protein
LASEQIPIAAAGEYINEIEWKRATQSRAEKSIAEKSRTEQSRSTHITSNISASPSILYVCRSGSYC